MVYFIVLGLFVAMIQKRQLLSLFHIQFRLPWLINVCFLAQIVVSLLEFRSVFVLPITFAGLAVGFYANRHLAGMRLLLCGLLLNTLAVGLHGGIMPVSEQALLKAGLDSDLAADPRHMMMTESSLRWLGDWIALIPPFGPRYVLSPGDVLVGLGLVFFIVNNSRRAGDPNAKQRS
jgi:hypothetical protein